jgi:hypothetical protein
VHRVAALLEWHVVVVTEGRDKDFGVPDKALAGREVGDLSAVVIQMSAIMVLCGWLRQHSVMSPPGGGEERELTSRMGPSGSSPILMVVHSCWVNAEPGKRASVSWRA